MANLGIFVTNPKNMAHVMGVNKAGLTEKEMSTQAKHGYIIEDCEKYMTL